MNYDAIPPDQLRQYTACGRKTVYPTRKAAETVASRITRDGRTRTKPYKCDYCGLYHLRSRGVKQ